MSLTEDIKDFGLDLGYSKVGITTTDSFPEYITRLNTNPEMYDWYIESGFKPLSGAEPKSVMPEAKSIVVLVYDYFKESFPENLTGKIGRIYLSRSYLTPKYRINGARRSLMRDFLENNGCRVASRLVVPERLAAARAGVTNYGKNTFAFIDGTGSFIVITALVVDKELDYDEPDLKIKCPPDCTACIDACPTGAIYEPLRINPRKCIAFNSFTTQDDYVSNVSSYIPYEIREKMGSWIHGCDICQEVCPRNKKKLKARLPENEFLNRIARDFDLRKVLNLSDEYYARILYPVTYNYIKEKKYLQRNAAIALGNSRDTAFIPDLAIAMEDAEEMVRAYAAWALGRIGGRKAKEILESSLNRETAETVIEEIKNALSVCG